MVLKYVSDCYVDLFSFFSGANIFLHYSSSLGPKSSSASSNSTLGIGRTDSSESDMDDLFIGSPRLQRKVKSKLRQRSNHIGNSKANTNNNGSEGQSHVPSEVTDELAYIDTLPEEGKLVEVTSNIWGTKFKIHGLAKTVPANLGQVTYKTSLLHLQPRQMTLVITELRDDYPTGPDPNFNPNIFSEDEDEHVTLSNNGGPPRRSNEGPPAIAPMSPQPGRFNPRHRHNQSTKSTEKRSGLGPLAKTESYEDELSYGESSETHSHQPPVRPKHIETSSTRPGPSYASLVTQYSRSASSSSGQSRHAISPLCSEGVPTLQSPKNAVGPSDIIFDRPPAGQTTMMNYSSNADYSVNIGQVKSALMPDQVRINSQVTPVPLNLNLNLERNEPKIKNDKFMVKKKDLKYIDDETPTTSGAMPALPAPPAESKMHRTSTIVSIAPACLNDSITRSCSVGYLDSVEITPSDLALSLLRKETPNKRLVLVDRKPKKNKKQVDESKRLRQLKCAKSKSLDLRELLQSAPKSNITNEQANAMPKLFESTELEQSSNRNASSNTIKAQIASSLDHNSNKEVFGDKMITKHCSKCKANGVCSECQKMLQEITVDNHISGNGGAPSTNEAMRNKAMPMPSKSACDQIYSEPIVRASCSKNLKGSIDYESKPPPRASKAGRRSEVITSYTDSPLFSRKHRFGNDSSSSRFSDNRSPTLSRRFENGFSFIKQLSEARKRRKEESAQNSMANSTVDLGPVEAIPMEQKSSISLHTQVRENSTNHCEGCASPLVVSDIYLFHVFPWVFPGINHTRKYYKSVARS